MKPTGVSLLIVESRKEKEREERGEAREGREERRESLICWQKSSQRRKREEP